MRIIAGKYKGRSLKTLTGLETRPTTDKIKEALFSMIGPYFNGGNVLDLYAGTGNLGFEAISRGCNHAIFIDQNPKAIQLIHENAQNLNVHDQIEIYRNDAARALKKLAKRDLLFDYIFLDPPYHLRQIEKIITEITLKTLLHPDGIIVIEHEKQYQINPIKSGYQLIKENTHGISTLSILKKGE
jgi:16S rRNA (guanine(966)-N(2))-methyltransferase RsmD